MLDSVRTRLTLWSAAVLTLALVSFSVMTYYVAARTFYARQDESLRSTAETVASAYIQELREENSAAKANEVVLGQIIYPNRSVEIIDALGHVVASSRNLSGHALPVTPETLLEAKARGVSYQSQPGFAGADNDDGGLRVAVVPLAAGTGGGEGGYAAVAESLGVIDADLQQLRHDCYAGIPVLLLLASLGGYFLARKSLAPIALMNWQTRRVTAQNLASRLDVPNPRDELGRLALTINELLARLDVAFAEQQRFIADASHELRTPVAILRGEAEVALERERLPEEYRDSLGIIAEESERLSHIVDALFTLTSTPRRAASSPMRERLYLNELVAGCVRAAQSLAVRKNISLKIGALPETLLIGDEELLKQMLLNLLDNAVKYTPAGGEVSVRLEKSAGAAHIEIRDNGIGIPAAEQAHIFDRFYRVDKTRSRAAGGAGLGLAIVRWVVEAHGGAIGVASTMGRGSVFSVTMPLVNGLTGELHENPRAT